MEENNKEQADEGSPLKEGDDDDVVGPQDQIVKVDIANLMMIVSLSLLCYSQGNRRDWSLAGREKSDCLSGLHPWLGANISHSFLAPQD